MTIDTDLVDLEAFDCSCLISAPASKRRVAAIMIVSILAVNGVRSMFDLRRLPIRDFEASRMVAVTAENETRSVVIGSGAAPAPSIAPSGSSTSPSSSPSSSPSTSQFPSMAPSSIHLIQSDSTSHFPSSAPSASPSAEQTPRTSSISSNVAADPVCQTCRLPHVCEACREAHVGGHSKCIDKVQRFLTGAYNNRTLEEALQIVSGGFDGACSVCDPKLCLGNTAPSSIDLIQSDSTSHFPSSAPSVGHSAEQTPRTSSISSNVAADPVCQTCRLPHVCEACREAHFGGHSKCIDKVERFLSGAYNNRTLEEALQIVSGGFDGACSVCDPKLCLGSTSAEAKAICGVEDLCMECKSASVGNHFLCVDRIKRFMNDNTTLEKVQKFVSGEFDGACSACAPETCPCGQEAPNRTRYEESKESVENLCEECRAATVGDYFTCTARIERFISGDNNTMTLKEAQKIVSSEFEGPCSACDPDTCAYGKQAAKKTDEKGICETCRVENLCTECKTSWIGKHFTCAARLNRFLFGGMTLEDAQKLVSSEFDGACAACDPNTCSSNLPPPPEKTTAIFYNVYLPPNKTEHGLSIVREQLQTRQYSSLRDAPLYYTQIGNTTAAFPPCNACEQIQRVESGDEILTLRALHRYCVDNPAHRVAYIHNKGSFTDTDNNRRLRHALNKAVFSDECARMPTNTTCDVCSVHFAVFPFHSTPGNMFLADCSHVNKLIQPEEFVNKKVAVYEKARNVTRFARAQPAYQFERDAWIGLGRFAMEHWMYSHPETRPCDVYRNRLFSYENPPLALEWVPSRRMAPNYTKENIRMGYHPWFVIEGRLFEWKELYSAVPPEDSWVWKFYGDRRYPSRAAYDALTATVGK